MADLMVPSSLAMPCGERTCCWCQAPSVGHGCGSTTYMDDSLTVRTVGPTALNLPLEVLALGPLHLDDAVLHGHGHLTEAQTPQRLFDLPKGPPDVAQGDG